MAKRFWVIFAVMVLSANLAYAAEGNTKASAAPAPFFKDPTSGIEMVYVKGGCYMMGNLFYEERTRDPEHPEYERPEERPVHEVCVDDFYIGKYEVTQGQWKSIMGSNPSYYSNCSENCPVDSVSYSDVQDFINKLNSGSGGNKYRLPTEAEWEYAARSGGKREKYSGGNDLDRVAWYIGNSENNHFPVGLKAPNGLGIYDMSGNVFEMTNDWYARDYYSNSPRNNPKGPSSGIDRAIRGGCQSGGEDNQRTSRRDNIAEMADSDRSEMVGFRLLRTP
jgi:sulfatase modifying factor 1